MKMVYLKKLEISNWRGQNRVVDFDVETTIIQGQNGCGKTSVMSAWFWLLSGYTDTTTPQNYNIFDNTKELTKDTPSASVKAYIMTDLTEWVLEKKVTAAFKRDKANDVWVKASSDTYTYHIDGIEVSATEYKAWIEANICPIDMIEFCMCGQFFSGLTIEDKKAARRHLERICGEINIEDLNGRDYSSLMSMFAKGYTIEKIKESFKSTLKSLSESADKIPVEIDSKEAIIAELSATDFDEIEHEVERYEEQLEEIARKVSLNKAYSEEEAKSLNAVLEEIASKRMELSKCRGEYLDAQNALKMKIKHQISDVEYYNACDVVKHNEKIKKQRRDDEQALAIEESHLVALNEERNRLVEERNEAKAMVFDGEVCSFCGQELPYDMLEESKRKFNEKKEDRIAFIINQGLAVKSKIEASEKKIASLKSSLDKEDDYLEPKDCSELVLQLEEIEANEIPFEDTDVYKSITHLIAILVERADEIRESAVESHDYEEERREINTKLKELNKELGKKSLIEKYQEDVIELQRKRRELGIECAELEGKIALCDAFVEEKAQLVSNRINDKLEGCEIQMWERLKNGDLTPACTVQSKDGVKLATINYSRRLLIEAELQKLFCKAFDIKMPIFYDEANVFDSEHKPTSDGWQIVLLQASDDKRLIVK